jgi:DNA-binding beta-propeller fold protein YncE
MKKHFSPALAAACLFTLTTSFSIAQPKPATTYQPYKVVKSEKVGGDGAFDYLYAEAASRKLYVPRGDSVRVYDLDTLKLVKEIPDCKGARGVAIDPKSHHGFSSSSPVVMWDSETLATIKTIPVEGKPDAMFFDPTTEHVYVFSHVAPNATVLDSKDGTIVGTIDLGGAPEQAVSDNQGHIYVNLEDKAQVAVIDAKTLKVTAHYDFSDKGKVATGLAMDVKNRILYACCRNPAICVILNADDGKVITTLPIGAWCDGAVFNPATQEIFTSQRDGTLTVIKQTSPGHFEVLQNVETKTGAKTCTLDSKTNQIVTITADRLPPPPAPAAAPGASAPRPGRGQIIPETFTILVVGN